MSENKVYKRFNIRYLILVLIAAVIICQIPPISFDQVLKAKALTVDWFTPSVSDMTQNFWDGGMISLSNLQSGGVQVNWNNAITNVRIGVNRKTPLDGMAIQLDGLTAGEGSNANFAVLMANDPLSSYDVESKVIPALLFDTTNGQVFWMPNGHRVIDPNNGLKYDNIHNKTIEIVFEKGSGKYNVTLTVGSSVFKGVIPDSEMTGFSQFNADNDVCALLTAWKFNWDNPPSQTFSVQYKGLGKVVKDDHEPEIEFEVPKVSGLTTNFWESNGMLSLSDLPEGGVQMTWNSAVTNVRIGVNKSMPLDGMAIKLANLTAGEGSNANFAVLFANAATSSYSTESKVIPALLFDTTNGQVFWAPDGHRVIDPNNGLKYDNLKSKTIEIRIAKASGGYNVTVKAGSSKFEGSIPDDKMAGFTEFDVNRDVYALLTAWRFPWDEPPGQTFSVQYKGLGKIVVTEPDPDMEIEAPNVSGMTTNHWAGDGRLALSDLTEGGVQINWNNAVTNVRVGVNKSMPLDGMVIKLANLTAGEGSNANFAVLLANNPDLSYSTESKDIPALLFDTTNGQVLWMPDEYRVVGPDNGLKYENLKNKNIDILFEKAGGGYNVTIKVGSAKYEGSISNDKFTGFSKFNVNEGVYALLTAWRFTWDEPPGQNLSVQYKGLGRIVIPEPDPDMEIEVPNSNGMTTNHWVGNGWLALSDLTEGGVQINWNNAVTNVRIGVNKAMPLNGMVIRLANLTAGEGSNANFAVLLANNADSSYSTESKVIPALLFDTTNGQVFWSPDGHRVINPNDGLKYDNIKNKTIEIRFVKVSGGYSVTIKIGSAKFEGSIPDDKMTGFTEFNAKKDVYALLTAWRFPWDEPPGQNLSVQYKGLGRIVGVEDPEETNTPEEINAVINAIDAIGTVSLSNGAPIRLARKAYDALTESGKGQVSNYSKLLEAEAQYASLAERADSKLNYINKANALLSSSTMEHVKNTLQAWARFMTLTDLPYGKGLRYKFTDAPTNVREGFGADVNLDGLVLQFDNLDRENASSGQLALYFADSGTRPYGGSYESSMSPLALVIDVNEGTIKSYPSETVVLQSDLLKFNSLGYRRWSLTFEETNGDYKVTLTVNEQTATGVIPKAIMDQAENLKNPVACIVTLSSWGKQSLSIDFIGVTSGYMPDEVIQLIDDIGMVTLDSRNAIEAAEAAYEKLPEKAKAMVVNHNQLVTARRIYDSLDYNRMVATAIELINKIGTVNLMSGEKIMEAQDMFNRLTEQQKKEVTNADKLKSAIEKYFKMIKPYMAVESALYGPGLNAQLSIASSYSQSWWQDHIIASFTEDNHLKIEWNDAIRNMRNGPATKYNLDGLYLQLTNITKDSGRDGTRLAIMFGTDLYTEYASEKSSLAIVLDTATGSIYAFPTGKLILQTDLLKHDNIEKEIIGFQFKKTDEGLFALHVYVGGNRLSTVIPGLAVLRADAIKNLDSVNMVMSCWTDNDSGIVDGSKHTFSAELVSIQDSGTFAFEELFKVITAIDELPEKATLDNIDRIKEVNDMYLSLTRPMRKQVNNYSKLKKLIDQMYELTYGKVDLPDLPEDVDTGENSKAWIAAVILLLAVSALFISRIKSKGKNQSGMNASQV